MVVSKPIRTNFKASTTTGHNQVSVEAFRPRCRVTRLALPLSPDDGGVWKTEADHFGSSAPGTWIFRQHQASCPDSAGGACPWLESSCCKQGRTRSWLGKEYASGQVQCQITNHIEFMPSSVINYCAYVWYYAYICRIYLPNMYLYI